MPAIKIATREGRYRRAIDELIRSWDRDKAALHAKVSRGTIDRWFQDPRFQELLKSAQENQAKATMQEFWTVLNEVLDALRRNLASGQPASEIRAAKELAELALRIREHVGLSERLDRLESISGEET